MKKQVWLTAMVLGCSVLMAGCGAADRSYQKGIQAMQSGNYEDAGRYLQKAVKENSERAEYYIAYGMYLNEQGEYKNALKQFKKAYQDTENTIANVNNKQVYLGQAIAYARLREYDKALELCDKALKLKNTPSLNNRIWCSKGVVLEAIGEQEEALKAYRKAADENKENWQAYYRLTAIYQEIGDADAAGQAQDFLDTAYQKGDTEATYYLGLLYTSAGDNEKGKKYLTKFVSKGHGECLQNAYNCLAAMAIGEEDYNAAQEYLSKARASAKGEAAQTLSKNQMILMERQGMFGEALTIAQDYLKQYPDDQAMKREFRFLKTRNAVALGNGTVRDETDASGNGKDQGNSTADGDNNNSSGGSSTGSTAADGTADAKVTKSPAISNNSTSATTEPSVSSSTDSTRSSTKATAAPAASSAAQQSRTDNAATATAAPDKTASSYTDTEENVGQ